MIQENVQVLKMFINSDIMNGWRTVEEYLKFLKCAWIDFNTGLRTVEECVEFLKGTWINFNNGSRTFEGKLYS